LTGAFLGLIIERSIPSSGATAERVPFFPPHQDGDGPRNALFIEVIWVFPVVRHWGGE
jgi:hypothetical protein